MEEVSIYIHIPYCKRKCGYCDFNSYPDREAEHEGYVRALLTELGRRAPALSSASVPSIFFGGGTPTVMGAERMNSILARCKELFTTAPQTEITLEANPETLSLPMLDALVIAGFNRISIGVQSFDDMNLRRLGRNHDGAQASRAIALAKEAGFENISLDLMFGIPGQEPAQWMDDIAMALSLAPKHISVYGLKIEEKTPFDRLLKLGIISLPDEEAYCQMYCGAVENLAKAGFEHYEISNFARAGHRCRHNVNYWRNGQYLGVGAGAHSYLRGERSANIIEPLVYMTMVEEGGETVKFRERLTHRAASGEALMLGLRLIEGVEMEEYSQRFGIDICEEYAQPIRKLSQEGLVEINSGKLKLTPRGILLSEEVVLRFL